ncbi:vomeronasal type-1 receptor 42-like [Tachyglossus aculeatus]|uniref:vomeronasal type-1 receptor 42-like n=1 Tax=Tachyglossus aculeatus TaxID=9261 RepID=UPI0018F66FBE|nr:vomeronasal type-1 receptor 42-like [Tachyglossus aculeatus]
MALDFCTTNNINHFRRDTVPLLQISFLDTLSLKVLTFYSAMIGVEVMGNSLLITLHVSTILLEPRPKPTDLVIVHLALVHRNAPYQSCHCVSISSASAAPADGPQCPVRKHILPILILLWLLNSIVDINLLFNTVASLNVTSCKPTFSDDYCSVRPVSSLVGLFLFFMALRDVLSLGIMGSSIGYMVVLLFRNSRKVWHLHGQHPPPRKYTETTATQTVLLLGSCFVPFYCKDFILSLILGSFLGNNIILLNANMFVVSSYATFSSVLLLSSNSRFAKF